jgi:hypothetical protein
MQRLLLSIYSERLDIYAFAIDHLLNCCIGVCRWNSDNPWTGYSPISVAWTVDVPKVLAYAKELLFNAQ